MTTPFFVLFEASWLSDISPLWAIVIICVLVGGGLIILLSKRREEIQLVETTRADANAKLVATRDMEIKDLKADKEKLEKELESTTAEYRVLVGINLDKLFAWWENYEQEMADKNKLIRENRSLRQQCGLPIHPQHQLGDGGQNDV